MVLAIRIYSCHRQLLHPGPLLPAKGTVPRLCPQFNSGKGERIVQ